MTPFLKVLSAVAIVFMTFALVGLAAGMGARYPRFAAENLTQVAGSYGGVAFMVLAVLFILVTVAPPRLARFDLPLAPDYRADAVSGRPPAWHGASCLAAAARPLRAHLLAPHAAGASAPSRTLG